MYILLTGEPPFPGNTEEEIFTNVFNTEANMDNPKLKNITDNCKDLIKKLLVKDPNKRLVSSDALKHEFFTSGINIGNLLKGKYKDNEHILRGMLKRNLTERVKTSKFKDVVIAYIAMNFSDENVEKEARQIFMEMSGGDKHFLITKESFVNKMEKICKDLTRQEIQDLFDTIDENETGNIEYEEIIRALTDKEKLLSEKNLKEAFQFFDKDNSGMISWNEIAEIVYPEGKIPQNTIKEFLDEIGQKDENMQIDFNGFKKILKYK
jgi:calcium-dependent protein kinase